MESSLRSNKNTGCMDSSFQSDTAQEQAKVTTFFDQNLSAINQCVLDSVPPDAEPILPLKKANFKI